jgi:phosphoribosylanthranilate isomerase
MINQLKIKVCGLKNPENILLLDNLPIEYLGFIFYNQSKRDASGLEPTILRNLKAKKVGVFVNEGLYEILQKVILYKLDAVQLHGDESPEECAYLKKLGLEVFKVFAVDETFDFGQLEPYKESVNYFLFDTKGKERGGNGVAFNWDILRKYDNEIPVILSGGINPSNLPDALTIDFLNLYALDLNSGFELEPGLKDVPLLKKCIEG